MTLEPSFMHKADYTVFATLFREAFEKCFGRPLTAALSEPESRRMSDVILERTGLVIGWKSIKNYSIFILDHAHRREENPSLATLDTFARYVLDAPKIDEIQRQDQERQSSYWFQYRESHPTDAGRRRAS